MTPEQAVWVYEHVILGYHDANQTNWWCDPDQSDGRLICACQLPCAWCTSGQHDRCRRGLERQQAEALRAQQVDPYGDGTPRRPWKPLGHGPETHLRAPAPWRLATRKRPLYLAVWLADRVCRYLCACTACGRPAAPTPIPAAPVSAVALVVSDGTEQLGLFEAVSTQ